MESTAQVVTPILEKAETFIRDLFSNRVPKEYSYHTIDHTLRVVRKLDEMAIKAGCTDKEREILARYGKSSDVHDLASMGLARLTGEDTIVKFRRRVREVKVEEGIVAYVQKLLEGTRRSPHLHLGVSPRGGIALLKTSQCLAAMRGRDFIVPDDIKEMALPVLRHRVILRPEAELERLTPDRVLSQILEGIPVPR